jgi:S-adenosylmethionine hydrolase
MSIISLITDFGLKDNFVGVIKAVILGVNPDSQIVDICHEIKPQDILEAAFLLRGSYRYFPRDSLHVVVVDPGVGSRRRKILVKTKNYYFMAPDNGVLSLALKEELPLKIIEITNEKYFLKPASNTFHARDIFAPVAGFVSKGIHINQFGRATKSLKELEIPEVKIKSDSLSGEIIYIDRFGNLVSNIGKKQLDNFIKNKKFRILIGKKSIERLSRAYSDVAPLQPLALMDSFGYLEIALNLGSAKDYFGIDKGDEITIKRIKCKK